MLELISKNCQGQSEVYNFILDGKKISQDYAGSLKLISCTKPGERNCRIINGAISLKKGQLPVYSNKNKNDQHKNVLRIYTKKELFPKCLFIPSADIEFIKLYTNDGFLSAHKKIIKEIDNAVIVNKVTHEMRTPYGITSTINMSTGLKTILIAYYYMENSKGTVVLSANECGANTLEYLYRAVADSNVILYMSNAVLCLPEDYTYIVNNNVLKNSLDYYDYI